MSGFGLIAVAVALAMDAFAVALATGIKLQAVSFRQTFRLSWHFGLFQAMMPVIGWSSGLTVQSRIERYDHWVAFALLAFIGGKMICEAFGSGEEEQKKDPTKGASLVILSVATSIDALAVGFSLSLLNISIWTPALIIGLVAGTFTIAGLFIGKTAGSAGFLNKYAGIIGGTILTGIGIRILWEHHALDFIKTLV